MVESALATVEGPDKLLALIDRLKTERSDSQGAAPSKIRQAARELIAQMVKKDAAVFEEALGPLIKKLLEKEKTQPELKLAPSADKSP